MRVQQSPEFDRAFQSKLVKVLFQFPTESKVVLDYLESSMFDFAPAQWCIAKFKQIYKNYSLPASIAILQNELKLDIKRGLVKSEYVDAYTKFIARLTQPISEKTYILDHAGNYVRTVLLRDFIIQYGKQLDEGKELPWQQVEANADKILRLKDRLTGNLGLDYFSDIVARVKRRKVQKEVGMPTGLPIDRYFDRGGLPPKQLGCVIAPPGRGKSATLIYMAGTAILLGKRALYISLELDEEIVAERFDSRFSGIEINKLPKKPVSLKKSLRTLKKKYGETLRIKFFPPDNLTVAGLKGYLHNLESVAYYPDVVFIDYADNMSLREFGGGGADNDYSPLGRLYIALRGLAAEFNIPVWTASQSNRASMQKETIDIQDLADSFKKAAVSDVMFAIGQTKKERRDWRARLVLVKNRNGSLGAEQAVDFNTATIHIEPLGGAESEDMQKELPDG